MYTNIDAPLGVESIWQFIYDHSNKLPPNFPTSLILEILTIVMKHNVFSFADTFWLQLSRCYIDDVLGIWILAQCNNEDTWDRFKTTLNSWGSLRWKVQDPSPQPQFLDLNIKKQGTNIAFKTFQKSINLYLYTPPLSTHPSSCFKGLIFWELRRYWIQNSQTKSQEMLLNFLCRLLVRGHSLQALTPLFTQAAANLDSTTQNPSSVQPKAPNPLYIHWQFHPEGIQCSNIRRIYENTLQQHLEYNSMWVAISCPKNLRDCLTKTKLTLPPDINIHTLIEDLSQDQS